jgi:outer membrane protein TolC
VQAAQLALAAARAERYPSASLNGYYGVLGPTPASSHGVFSVTGAVNIPVWQGGRVKGDIEAAESTLRQRQAELADQRGKVEADLRTALIELETAEGQVRVADSNRAYAAETLTEARDRFAAGVSTTVEVVQAQEQVASAENDYIASLYSYHLARLSLARATGTAEAALPALLSSQPAERGSNP